LVQKMSELSVGTKSPIFLPRDQKSPNLVSQKNYFSVKILSAQAAVSGPIWQKSNQLVVCSSISLNHPLLGNEPLQAIQLSRAVKQDQTVKLGMSPILIDMVPASMTHVTISIDFLLDTQNVLATLAGLINGNAFLVAGGLSLAPPVAAAAKTISTISSKLISTFLPQPNQRKPILQFTGDFEIPPPSNGLYDGYYVIIGSSNPKNPLPSSTAKLEIVGNDLFINGQETMGLSYVILDVRCYPVRGRELSEGASWNKKLDQVEMIVQQTENDSSADRVQAVKQCQILIKEAQALLYEDPRYLTEESFKIIAESFEKCNKLLQKDVVVKASRGLPMPDFKLERSFFGIPSDEDLGATLNLYAYQKEETKRIMQEASQK
jgi:hypothetical protein